MKIELQGIKITSLPELKHEIGMLWVQTPEGGGQRLPAVLGRVHAQEARGRAPECLQCHQVLGSGASIPNRPFSGPKLYQKVKEIFKPLFCQLLNFQAGYCNLYTCVTLE